MSVSTKIRTGCSQEFKIRCVGEGWQTRNSACNRVIIVSTDDIKSKNINIPGKGNIVKSGITCPLCGCFTTISKEMMSPKYKRIIN